MKKIVGTILALGLAFSAFAAAPEAKLAVADFTGSAGFGWKADFADSDNLKMGMFNETSASIKVGILTEGTRETEGDGLWGDLQIKFADGLNWESKDAAKPAALPALNAPAVTTAKIHFKDGDFTAALNILKPSLEYGEFTAPAATGKTVKTMKVGDMKDMNAGFALELGMADTFALNVKFMDNGLAPVKNEGKKFGLALDASLLAVENLTAKVMGTFNFGTKYTGMAVEAGYKLGITDTMYVKPGAAFTMSKADKVDAVNNVEVGVLFGWGAADQEPGFKYVADKTTEGVSVGFAYDLKDSMAIVAGVYDQSLLSLVGTAEEVGVLKLGACFEMGQTKVASKSVSSTTVGAGMKYDITISPIYISLGGDLQVGKVTDLDAVTKWGLSVKLGSKEIIKNTDVYVAYDVADEAGKKKITKNEVKVGTTINF